MSISRKVSMFYNAKPIMFERAKELRTNMTNAENTVWELLKYKRLLGFRFRPQHPIDIFIADFYCHSLKLVIEIDGGIHSTRDRKDYDLGREEELSRYGIKVVRFTNKEVEDETNPIRQKIEVVCKDRIMELQSPLQGI